MPSNIRINNRVVSTLQVGDVIAQSAYYGQSFVFITAFDPDAATYIEAVEAADEQTLEAGVKLAIDGFVTGCKADGIWDAIKASCILAGARTLNGALVPLAGDAPTNFNFVSDDYDRVTGLKGDGSTKYLDTNRGNTADPQDNVHHSLFVGAPWSSLGSRILMGAGFSNNASMIRRHDSGEMRLYSRNSENYDQAPDFAEGFVSVSRSASSNFEVRIFGETGIRDASSGPPPETNVNVFRSEIASGQYFEGIISFYSIGEAIYPDALDARVTTLMTEIEAALT